MTRRTIGQLAREAGVNVETIRYYERIGIIRQPEAPAEGWRTYDDTTLRVVRFVKRAQALGLGLDDARALLDLRNDGGDCSSVRSIARAKLEEIEAKLRELTALRDALRSVADTCPGAGPTSGCPVLDLVEPPPSEGNRALPWRAV
ncbi:MAG: MerR family DNA-binding protein [Myxococcota bacterium]